MTPYGTSTFTQGGSGTTRFLETTYPDGSRDRVEFNQISWFVDGLPMSDPVADAFRTGMGAPINAIWIIGTLITGAAALALPVTGITARPRFTIGCTRPTCARAFGHSGEYKEEPLENRVWYDYAGVVPPRLGLAAIICRHRVLGRCWMTVPPSYMSRLIIRFGHCDQLALIQLGARSVTSTT